MKKWHLVIVVVFFVMGLEVTLYYLRIFPENKNIYEFLYQKLVKMVKHES